MAFPRLSEAQVDNSEILTEVCNRLVENGIPAENREFIVKLLKAVITPADERPREAAWDTIHRLADALANGKNVLATLQRQSAELDALKRITRNLTASLDLQEVLTAIAQEAMRLVNNAQDVQIFLYSGGRLSFGTSLLRNGEMGKPFAEPRPEGLTHTVARQKQTIIVEDMDSHPLFRDKRGEWRGSIIGIPLRMGEEIVGVMNLARSQPGPFSSSEIRLLDLLADQAAIAIHNASLHKTVRETALLDMLTGLPNRRALDERLDSEIRRAARTGLSFTVMMMDLDGFKTINDTYGHDVGDDVLRQIACALRETLRATDFLARYGGDELTLILPDTGWPEAEVVVDKIRDRLSRLPLRLPDRADLRLGISGGVAVFPRHAVTAAGLLRAADEALYRAKRRTRGGFELAARPTGPLPDTP